MNVNEEIIKQNQTNDEIRLNRIDSDESKYKPDLKIVFKKYSKDWLMNSTIIGLSNILRSRFIIIKIIWTFFILFCLSFCLFLIINSIITYLEYNVLITIKNKHETLINFPAVTFCNLNPFNSRSKSYSIIDKILAENNISYVNNVRAKYDIHPNQILNLIKSNIYDKSNLNKQNSIGFNLNFMLISCSFNNLPCNESDFVYRYDYDYVNCYTFNSGYDTHGNNVAIKKVSESGHERSLKIELFLDLDRVNNTKFIKNNGVRIVVHNQSISPIISSEGIDVTTGFQNNIGIRRLVLNKLNTPVSNCIQDNRSPLSYDSKYYKAIFNRLNMTTYRQKICNRLCLQDYVYKRCNCIDGSLPSIYSNASVCHSLNTLNCVFERKLEYFNSDDSSLCTGCPIECESVSYKLFQSYSRYPTEFYLKYMRNRSSLFEKVEEEKYYVESELSKSTVKVNIFYDEMEYQIINEVQALTFDTLISNIGGNLGLFIGISVLSIFELVEYLIQFILFCFKNHNLF